MYTGVNSIIQVLDIEKACEASMSNYGIVGPIRAGKNLSHLYYRPKQQSSEHTRGGEKL